MIDYDPRLITPRFPHSDTTALWLWQHGPVFLGNGPAPELPRVAVLILGDGRDAIRRQTVRSFLEHARGYHLADVVEVDDRDHTLGFCGAIQYGWRALIERERWRRSCGGDGGWEYVFHLEEDWLFNRSFDVREMVQVLDGGTVVQCALKRGPVNEVERNAGGLVEQWPDEYETCGHVAAGDGIDASWLEHRLFWTTNPCLYRMSLLSLYEWPDGPACERAFTDVCLEDGWRFAFLGAHGDKPWITHNGARTGTGY